MEYRVLARKYRPTNFDDLVGQEALVRTLGNAFRTGRIAHAFLLTGIRGIGKTTTARIIARGLNCIGADGTNTQPTTKPCGVCSNCTMIGDDRHPDVMEMDAASRTGVENMRELIEMVRYLPSTARMKVYIIDEVHMLSTSAFNALLKTLEEPPPHVKFIFATTEVRKIPVTILSRCQRFDLKRLDGAALANHLGNVAAKEGVRIDTDALNLLSLSAEGSVRDGLSLLDQAIAHHTDGSAEITAPEVRHMLGLADRSSILALLTALFKGEIESCLTLFSDMYIAGADPLTVLQDCLEMLHLTTRIQINNTAANDPAFSDAERAAAKRLADEITVPALARAWQMLLKGVNEARFAPSPKAAVEMVLIRVAYASNLPTPEEAITQIQKQPQPLVQTSPPAAPRNSPSVAAAVSVQSTPSPQPTSNQPLASMPASMEEVVALLDSRREALVASQLREYASLVAIEAGRLEINLLQELGREFTSKLAVILSDLTGIEWKIILSKQQGEPTMASKQAQIKAQKAEQIANDPLVSSIMNAFPGAKLVN
jgi:DNA polymerase-3 subunit gamma/tau